MTIKGFQIQNIISSYHKQLKINNRTDRRESESVVDKSDKVVITDEGKKKHMFERMRSNALSEYHRSALEDVRKD